MPRTLFVEYGGNPEVTEETVVNQNDHNIAVPAGKQWFVYAILVEYTTSASGSDRNMILEVRDDSNNIIARAIARNSHETNKTFFYSWIGSGLSASTASEVGKQAFTSDIPQMPLASLWNIRHYDQWNRDSGDSFSMRIVHTTRDA